MNLVRYRAPSRSEVHIDLRCACKIVKNKKGTIGDARSSQPSEELVQQPVELARRLIDFRQRVVFAQQSGGVDVGVVALG